MMKENNYLKRFEIYRSKFAKFWPEDKCSIEEINVFIKEGAVKENVELLYSLEDIMMLHEIEQKI